jgi:hypothetical protein
MIKYSLILFFCLTSLLLGAQSPKQKNLGQLINQKESAWPMVQQMIKDAKNKVEVLPRDKARAERELVASQVATGYPLGTVIFETGGILVDNGWIRILGSGSSKLGRSIMKWNEGKSFKKVGEQPSFLLIADDPVGGFYALNNGAMGKEDYGKVFYFAPDELKWESLGMGYSDFLAFCFSADLQGFYTGLRWKNWEKDISKLSPDKGYVFTPDIWTKQALDINKMSKKEALMQDIWSLFF